MERPIRRFVVPGIRELMRLSSVRKHGPDLPRTGARGFENDVAAIRRPTWALIAASVARQFNNLAARDIHDVDVIVIVGPAPTKSEQLSIGRP